MQFTRELWVALGAAAIVAGCAGSHALTPASGALAEVRAAHAVARADATPTPKPCSDYQPSVPMWSYTFSYHDHYGKGWFVPETANTITIVAEGAQGSSGLGGCVRATIPVKPKEELDLNAGGPGTTGTSALGYGQGGYNGGGNGGKGCCGGNPGGGGGGASDVREGGNGLANRVIVAGGGGGSSGNGWTGGLGGGTTGTDGAQDPNYPRGAGGGGTQSQGGAGATGATAGALGNGGNGGAKSASGTFGGGGGGGGYYGGGGGRYSHHDDATKLDDGDSGGGGGSGFAEAKATSVYQATGEHYGAGSVTISWPQVKQQIASGLSSPGPIAVDKSGNVFVGTSKTYVTFISGRDGKQQQVGSGFHKVVAIAVDYRDNVYVSDGYDQAVYKVAPPFNAPAYGTKTTVDPNVQAKALAVDVHGNVYEAERCGKNCGEIAKVVPGGKPVAFAKDFYEPTGLAMWPNCSKNCGLFETDIYYGFYTYYYMYSVSPTGVKTPFSVGFLAQPVAVADYQGTAYVLDQQLKAIAEVPLGGVPFSIGSNWGYPTGIAVPPDCTDICPVYVTDYVNDTVVEVK